MSRSDIPDIAARRPFYLYVDEFQNFATDSFAVILSEARKYGLNLTVANQYVAQMTDSVRDAVFGNVGTTIAFRVSADDAPILAKQFEPTFDESDLLQLNNRNFVISMIIDGEKAPAFSATTLSLPDTPKDNLEAIIAHSRENFGRPRLEVEAEIRAMIEQASKYKQELADSGRQQPKLTIKSGEMVFQPAATPQADFRRQKISPNTAEGKKSLGLKDLAALVTGKQGSEPQAKTHEKPAKKRSKRDKKEKHANKADRATRVQPMVPSVRANSVSVKDDSASVKADSASVNSEKAHHSNSVNREKTHHSSSAYSEEAHHSSDGGLSPVRPEVEYQEKSTVEIHPSHHNLPLNTPVKEPEDFAAKDNSVDGFLSVKH